MFWGLTEDTPIDKKIFIKHLKKELVKTGVSQEDAKKYTFHAWRHYFTRHMYSKIENKILKHQAGHKTDVILNHYADHSLSIDKEKL